jgi:threonine dehydrogenase-like Zn-dependent dehydrogenase
VRISSPDLAGCNLFFFNSVCRLGYTGRCPSGVLFGSPLLEGGQAQFVRVPKAGGTLYNLSDPQAWSLSVSDKNAVAAISSIADSSLLLLSDILPTGVFAALQTLNHPKVQPMLTGKAWPNSCLQMTSHMPLAQDPLLPEDRILNLAIVGSGPVGICAAVSLLDMLARNDLEFRIVAIDPNESRRQKMLAVYNVIPKDARGKGEFVVQDIEEAKETMKGWTGGIGATAVLEV